MYLGKCCLLALYYRLFGHITSARYQIYATAFLGLPLVWVTIINVVVGVPPDGAPWGTRNPRSTEALKWGVVQGATNIAVDLIIFYIPIPIVWTLQLSQRKRNGVLAIFFTGLMYVSLSLSSELGLTMSAVPL